MRNKFSHILVFNIERRRGVAYMAELSVRPERFFHYCSRTQRQTNRGKLVGGKNTSL